MKFIIKVAHKESDYVEEADKGKSVFNSDINYAQQFGTAEAAQIAARNIPANLEVVPMPTFPNTGNTGAEETGSFPCR